MEVEESGLIWSGRRKTRILYVGGRLALDRLSWRRRHWGFRAKQIALYKYNVQKYFMYTLYIIQKFFIFFITRDSYNSMRLVLLSLFYLQQKNKGRSKTKQLVNDYSWNPTPGNPSSLPDSSLSHVCPWLSPKLMSRPQWAPAKLQECLTPTLSPSLWEECT